MKIRNFLIQTTDGYHEVNLPCELFSSTPRSNANGYIVHKAIDGDLYNVTHQNTGHSCGTRLKLKQARFFAQWLSQHLDAYCGMGFQKTPADCIKVAKTPLIEATNKKLHNVGNLIVDLVHRLRSDIPFTPLDIACLNACHVGALDSRLALILPGVNA